MSIQELTEHARNKGNFLSLQGYLDFCEYFLEFVASGDLQAVIVSKNENHYRFWQYNEDANFQITRPINSRLMYDANSFQAIKAEFINIFENIRELEQSDNLRETINKSIYTIQQCIGAALDALPAGQSNFARKINGDLFERFIRLILVCMGVDAVSGTVRVPVIVQNEEQFKMNYQHDLILKYDGEIKILGSVKTTSKDRIDKIFMDKFLYSRLTGSALPHIAIFLNDVQRKGVHPRYGISSTFLPGHFKGYTVKLNPLDGVYYCDIRPSMRTDVILRDHIKTIDTLLFTDIWNFLHHHQDIPIELDEDNEV